MECDPMDAPPVANVLAQQERLQPHLAPLEVAHRILTRPAQVPNRFVVNRGNVDRAQIPAAQQAGQRDGVPAISLHSIARLSWDERRRHDAATEPSPGQVSIQPIPARPRLVGEHERGALRFKLSDQLVDVALPRADRPQRYHLRPAILRRVRDGDGVLVNIETIGESLDHRGARTLLVVKPESPRELSSALTGRLEISTATTIRHSQPAELDLVE